MKHKNNVISIALATLVLVSLVAVATTSVNASDGSSAKVQTSGALVGAPIPVGAAPAVCAQDADNLHLFVRGTDGDLLWKTWNVKTGALSSWQSLGGKMTTDPAAVYRSPGKIDVFVRGESGVLWNAWSENYGGNWHWQEMTGKLLDGTSPAAYAFHDGRIGWIVTGESHAVWHAWIDAANQYHDYSPLGDGKLSSSPAVTSRVSNVLDVFGRGDSGALYWRSYNNGWSDWTSLGVQLAPGTGPAASSWDIRVDVFYVSTMHNEVFQGSFSVDLSGYHGSAVVPINGASYSSPAAVSRSPGVIDVFVRGGTGDIWNNGYRPYYWTGWGDFGGI